MIKSLGFLERRNSLGELTLKSYGTYLLMKLVHLNAIHVHECGESAEGISDKGKLSQPRRTNCGPETSPPKQLAPPSRVVGSR